MRHRSQSVCLRALGLHSRPSFRRWTISWVSTTSYYTVRVRRAKHCLVGAPGGSCNFEDGPCGWVNTGPPDALWQVKRLQTSIDAFALTASINGETTARAVMGASDCLILLQDTEISFWYHTYRTNNISTQAIITILMVDSEQAKHIIAQISDQPRDLAQSGSWTLLSAQPVSASPDRNVSFFLEAKSDRAGATVLIDSIFLKNEAELLVPCGTRTTPDPITTSVTATSPAVTSSPTLVTVR